MSTRAYDVSKAAVGSNEFRSSTCHSSQEAQMSVIRIFMKLLVLGEV